jgi:parallel beta-helix repeat protein
MGRKRAGSLLVGCCLAVGAGGTVVSSEPAAAGPAACPTPITSDTTLTSDCVGSIDITADNVTLDLGGHTVFCPSGSDGIDMTDRAEDRVVNGVIDCSGGNGNALEMIGGGEHDLTKLRILGPPPTFIPAVAAVGSHENRFQRLWVSTPGDALALISSNENLVRRNVFSRSSTGALLFDAHSNRVLGNAMVGNSFAGVHLVSGTGNLVAFNVAVFNGDTDLVDENVNCDANLWVFNLFFTRNQPCIH